MEILICIIIAYIDLGLNQAVRAMGTDPIHKPYWAMRPTIGGFIFASLFWFLAVIDSMMGHGQRGRGIAYGLCDSIEKLFGVSVILWGLMLVVGIFIDSIIIKTIIVAIISLVTMPIIFLVSSLIVIPLSFIISIPLDLLFPIKKEGRN